MCHATKRTRPAPSGRKPKSHKSKYTIDDIQTPSGLKFVLLELIEESLRANGNTGHPIAPLLHKALAVDILATIGDVDRAFAAWIAMPIVERRRLTGNWNFDLKALDSLRSRRILRSLGRRELATM